MMRASAFLLVTGMYLGILCVASRVMVELSHDSAISHLAATGHQGIYGDIIEGRGPNDLVGQIVPAASWQRLWSVEDTLPLGPIRHDLAYYDIHPPLYFWLLHLAVLLLGTGIGAGIALNAVIGVAVVGLTYAAARPLLRAEWKAWAACAVWVVSAGALSTSIEARPYLLFAALGMAFTVVMERVTRRGQVTPVLGIALAAISAAGTLTHYHFLLILLAGGVAVPAFGPSGRRRILLAWYGAATVVGIAVAVALHPQFMQSFARQENQAQAFAAAEMGRRAVLFVRRLSTFFVPLGLPVRIRRTVDRGLLALVLGLVGVAGIHWLGVKHKLQKAWASHRERFLVLGIPALVFCAQCLLYSTFRSPVHAVGDRYFSFFWPFLAIGVVAMLPRRRMVPWVLAITLSGSVAFLHQERGRKEAFSQQMEEAMEGVALVVTTDTRRGFLPRTLGPLPPDEPVLVLDGLDTDVVDQLLQESNGPLLFLVPPEDAGEILRVAGARNVAARPQGTMPNGEWIIRTAPESDSQGSPPTLPDAQGFQDAVVNALDGGRGNHDFRHAGSALGSSEAEPILLEVNP